MNAAHGTLSALVIDDDKPIQSLVKGTLLRMGVRDVEVASDGQQALTLVNSAARINAPFDLIISDWDMPIMDGITFVEKYKETGKQSVIVMLTGRSDTSDFTHAKRLGVAYFFMKPLETDMLRIRLGGALDAAVANK